MMCADRERQKGELKSCWGESKAVSWEMLSFERQSGLVAKKAHSEA